MPAPRHAPPTLLRAAVMTSCATLVLGVIGVFAFRGREIAEPPSHEGLRVLVRGVEGGSALRVVARWRVPGQGMLTETAQPGAHEDEWRLTHVPRDVALIVSVYRQEDGRLVLVDERPTSFAFGRTTFVFDPDR